MLIYSTTSKLKKKKGKVANVNSYKFFRHEKPFEVTEAK